MSTVSILMLVVCCMETGAATDRIPGYGLPRVFKTFHPITVPSLAYAYIVGGGGSLESSPEAVLWVYVSMVVRSSARPSRMVSFISWSRGTAGVDISSKV